MINLKLEKHLNILTVLVISVCDTIYFYRNSKYIHIQKECLDSSSKDFGGIRGE